MIGWGALFFVICIMAVDLIPIPAWEDIELSLSFPIMIGVAMLYSPPVAGMIAIIGSSDIHELRRDTPFLRAMWNRSQMALGDRGGELGLPRARRRDQPLVDPGPRGPRRHGRRLHDQRDPGGAPRLAPARAHGSAGPAEDARLAAGRVPGVIHRPGALRRGHRALLHRGGSVVGRRVPCAARLRPSDVLPEPDDGGSPRGAERAVDGASTTVGEPPPQGERHGRPAPGAEPDEGRIRRGRLARAADAHHGDDRVREDAPAAPVRRRRPAA